MKTWGGGANATVQVLKLQTNDDSFQFHDWTCLSRSLQISEAQDSGQSSEPGLFTVWGDESGLHGVQPSEEQTAGCGSHLRYRCSPEVDSVKKHRSGDRQ